MARRTVDGSRAIVTGASSGIGRALALLLAERGASVVAVARSREKLEQLAAESTAGGRIAILPGDVTHLDTREAAVSMAVERFGGLDLLVNNAGIGTVGRFADASPERLRTIMEVNFFAAAEMIRLALPTLQSGRRPMIVNVASILGHRGIPRMSEYCASKFALRGFSQSLRAELYRLGIDLLVVSPGTTATSFFDHVDQDSVPWPKERGVTPEHVARRTVQAIERGKHEILVNARGRLLVLASRLAPGLMDRLMARYG